MTININRCSRNDAIIKSFACRTKYLRDSFPHKFFKSIMLLFIRQRKLNFCCTGQTDNNNTDFTYKYFSFYY